MDMQHTLFIADIALFQIVCLASNLLDVLTKNEISILCISLARIRDCLGSIIISFRSFLVKWVV